MKQNSHETKYKEAYAFLLERLRQARLDAGLSQQEAATLLGTHQSYVSRCEQGARKLDIIELQIFADIYGKPLEYFLIVDGK